ncbi:MAG: atpC [Candidatus Saccharibacteria bacterium]|nr:atpC [Candidatus Saccharibacteria bacterium]
MADVITEGSVVSQTPIEDKEKRTIHIKVYSPFKTYFNEDAYSISAVNSTGPFDILPKHHNFMTLLSPCELVINRDSGQIKIRIARGVMHVKANNVVVFLDV